MNILIKMAQRCLHDHYNRHQSYLMTTVSRKHLPETLVDFRAELDKTMDTRLMEPQEVYNIAVRVVANYLSRSI